MVCADGRERNYFCEIFAEHARESGDGAAGDDEKEAPAVEEGGDAAEAIANVAVEAAGFGIGGGELGVSERAEQREDAADDPDEEREADGAVHLAKNGAGRSKDAGADDRADEEKQKIAEAECAKKWWHVLALLRRLREQTGGIITGDCGAVNEKLQEK